MFFLWSNQVSGLGEFHAIGNTSVRVLLWAGRVFFCCFSSLPLNVCECVRLIGLAWKRTIQWSNDKYNYYQKRKKIHDVISIFIAILWLAALNILHHKQHSPNLISCENLFGQLFLFLVLLSFSLLIYFIMLRCPSFTMLHEMKCFNATQQVD